MKTLFVSLLLVLLSQTAISKTKSAVTHTHEGKTHSHPLPSIGINHTHNKVKINTKKKNVYNALKRYGFKKHHLPLTENESEEANHSVNKSYSVSISSKGDLVIKKDKEKYTNTHKYKSKNYTFIGTDKGEWGGKLVAQNKNGKSKVLLYENIIKVIYHNKSLYVFTGLAHMGINRGAIYKVNSLNHSPTIERLTLLPGQPSAIFKKEIKNKASFFIVTSDGLVSYEQQDKIIKNESFSLNDELNVYLSKQFWYTLYPNSIVELEDKAVFGIRSGVVVVTLGYFSTVNKVEYFTK